MIYLRQSRLEDSSCTFPYADDTTFFKISDSLKEHSEFVENALNAALLWFNANGSLMNEIKTHNMLFTLKPVTMK